MSQSLTKLYAHIIFSTKKWVPFLKDKTLRSEIHAYLGGILKTMDSHPIIIGGIADHVHILCQTSKKYHISGIVGELKRASSIWIKTKGGILSEFYWQTGYGAFSIGRSEVNTVRAYIENQEQHHSMKTYQDEMRTFFKEYEIDYDERYAWD
jgi:putative transposase